MSTFAFIIDGEVAKISRIQETMDGGELFAGIHDNII